MGIQLDMTNVLLRAESRRSERSQTTILVAIRDALHLKPRGYIHYMLYSGGK